MMSKSGLCSVLASVVTMFSAFQPNRLAAGQTIATSQGQQQVTAVAAPAQLNLTQNQAAQIRAIDADTANKLIALRKAGLTSSDMHAQILQIRQDQQTRTAAVLTSDQQAIYQAILARAIRQRATATPPAPTSTPSATFAH